MFNLDCGRSGRCRNSAKQCTNHRAYSRRSDACLHPASAAQARKRFMDHASDVFLMRKSQGPIEVCYFLATRLRKTGPMATVSRIWEKEYAPTIRPRILASAAIARSTCCGGSTTANLTIFIHKLTVLMIGTNNVAIDDSARKDRRGRY